MDFQKENIIIALDGPAGVGKSTTAKKIAKETGCHFFDSGALYRAITYLTIKQFSVVNSETINKISVFLKTNPNLISLSWQNNIQQVFLDSTNITEQIRSEAISNNIKLIASNNDLRQKVNQIIHAQCTDGSFIIDGRDIGTVVFPNTAYKFFLTADIKIRAERRAKELGIDFDSQEFQRLFDDIKRRDKNDQERAIAPLKPAEDALIINSSNKTLEEITSLIITQIKEIYNNTLL